jgi:hypothetical protein
MPAKQLIPTAKPLLGSPRVPPHREEDVYIKLAEAVSMRCEENLKGPTAS